MLYFQRWLKKPKKIQRLLKNKKLYIWGAGTKGCLFLAHCAAKNKLIDQISFAIDINPLKIRKFLPGSLIEIKSKYDFFKAAKDNDVLLIANSAYKDEIKEEIERANMARVLIEIL